MTNYTIKQLSERNAISKIIDKIMINGRDELIKAYSKGHALFFTYDGKIECVDIMKGEEYLLEELQKLPSIDMGEQVWVKMEAWEDLLNKLQGELMKGKE